MNLRKATQTPKRRRAAGNTVIENHADSGSDDHHGQGDSLVRRFVVDVEHYTARADIDGVWEGVARLPAECQRRCPLVVDFDLCEGLSAVVKIDRAQRAGGVFLRKTHPFAVDLRFRWVVRQAGNSRRARGLVWAGLHGAGQEW